ncbi:hypothetical protein ACLM5J_03120 [Nocardioides sp. Bht2]|uniref:hypothetical protein n=1 Tax=Nocardioides sp. Bht2 TaxID=3392297 RepID=UPI0039B3B05C
MSISLVLDGDPEGCDQAAAALRSLADALDDGAQVAATVRTRSTEDWASPAGDRLRTVCTRHLSTSDRLRGTCRDLALRLGALATALREAGAELLHARAIARKAGISADTALPTFEEAQPLNEARATALDHAVAVAARAREIEAEAHADYAEAVTALLHALAPPPAVEEPHERGSVLGTLGDLLPDLPAPNLPSLPDLPDLPDLPGLPDLPDLPDLPRIDLSRLAALAEETAGPGLLDLPGDSILDRLVRAATLPGLEAGGALAGLALCTRARLPKSLLAACAETGGSAGSWIGRKLSERNDEQ